jgi:hypothetical protein
MRKMPSGFPCTHFIRNKQRNKNSRCLLHIPPKEKEAGRLLWLYNMK